MLKSRQIVALMISLSVLAIGCRPKREKAAAAVHLSTYAPEYYRVFYEAAHAEARAPGEDFDDTAISALRLSVALASARWAASVKGDMLLRKDGKFEYKYAAYKRPPKGVALLGFLPENPRQRLLEGTWRRDGKAVVLRITHEDGQSLETVSTWPGVWRGKHIVLPSTWDYPVPADTHLVVRD